jgi:hypothetical protein
MIKPILIKSDNDYSGLEIDTENGHILSRESYSYCCKNPYDIILINTEAKIKEGDLICLKLMGKNEQIGTYSYDIKHKTHDLITLCGSHYPYSTLEYFDKVIASTNKNHNLPKLSDQSIKLLIDYYDEYKNMPESVDQKYKELLFDFVDIIIPENEIEDTLNAFNKASDKLMNKFKVIDHLYTKEQIYQMLEECDSTRLTWSSDIDEWLNKH